MELSLSLCLFPKPLCSAVSLVQPQSQGLSKGETALSVKAPALPVGKSSVLHVAFETPLTTGLQPLSPGIPQAVESERRWEVRPKRTGTVKKDTSLLRGLRPMVKRWDDANSWTAGMQFALSQWAACSRGKDRLRPCSILMHVFKLNTACWRKPHWIQSWRVIFHRLNISTEILSDQNHQKGSSKILQVNKTEMMRVEAGLTKVGPGIEEAWRLFIYPWEKANDLAGDQHKGGRGIERDKGQWDQRLLTKGKGSGKGNNLAITGYTRIIWFPWWLDGKESACKVEDLGLIPELGRLPWRREWLPTPVFLPGKVHGRRSLLGCSLLSYPTVRQKWLHWHKWPSKRRYALLSGRDFWVSLSSNQNPQNSGILTQVLQQDPEQQGD